MRATPQWKANLERFGWTELVKPGAEFDSFLAERAAARAAARRRPRTGGVTMTPDLTGAGPASRGSPLLGPRASLGAGRRRPRQIPSARDGWAVERAAVRAAGRLDRAHRARGRVPGAHRRAARRRARAPRRRGGGQDALADAGRGDGGADRLRAAADAARLRAGDGASSSRSPRACWAATGPCATRSSGVVLGVVISYAFTRWLGVRLPVGPWGV